MNQTTFTPEDFQVFQVEGLDERMQAIRSQIQPKFRALGALFTKELAVLLGEELPVHIAQHLRRTKNPPLDTWSAIGGNARGYKRFPHFQLGLYEDHIFIWLAFIDQPQFEVEMANALIKARDMFEQVPADYVVSLDHHQKKVTPIKELDLKKGLERWRDVKKAEFLIGRQILATDALLKNPEATQAYILETFVTLVPFYQLAFQAYPNEIN
ncbi:YktB family protein [Isobaculum melis]|uniref:UPF0637 protein SAMN04488559_10516 n=1 Tax=Isobaculum melis TaxID=142588 RepID=A0A1H9RR95_9LACT|nr:DUF1054 domain-containing protein [Isobaculum melis]SER75226.1 Uncharacterized protein YktB, UPF0637 family [Isobaculum melis]